MDLWAWQWMQTSHRHIHHLRASCSAGASPGHWRLQQWLTTWLNLTWQLFNHSLVVELVLAGGWLNWEVVEGGCDTHKIKMCIHLLKTYERHKCLILRDNHLTHTHKIAHQRQHALNCIYIQSSSKLLARQGSEFFTPFHLSWNVSQQRSLAYVQ